MATCFALRRGSRGRLPFASGEAVKVSPPSWRSALCGLTASPPLRGWHSSGASGLLANQTPNLAGGWPGLGDTPRRYPGRRCAPAGPLWPLRTSEAGELRPQPGPRSLSMSSLLAEATAAAFPGCSEGCSRLRPEQGRDGRGRTALQWPVVTIANMLARGPRL